jgi:ubiquinone/menaquinone biosynthesis C-methylase UbiE
MTTTVDLHRQFLGSDPFAGSTDAMAAFLDGAARLPAVRTIRAAMRSALLDREAPPAATALLDAACGEGTETRALADALPDGHVVGLDRNPALLDVAAARTVPGTGIEWRCADVRHTGLPEASVAAVRVERGLIYVADAEVAVAEFARVLAPGGVFVGYELDYGGLVLPAGDADPGLLGEVHQVMAASLPAPWAGRRLARWLTGAGLNGVTVAPLNISAGPAVADRIVGDTVRAAVADGRLHPAALDWLDSLAHEPPELPALTVVGFLTTAVKRR